MTESHRGPRVRSDIVDVYIARRGLLGLEFLQLLRRTDPMRGTWQPVMGHIEAGETAVAAAKREAAEEVGLVMGPALDSASSTLVSASPAIGSAPPLLLGLWQLEQVHPFFLAASDEIVMSPRFIAEVGQMWKPVLNHEHSEWRWVQEAKVNELFVWPGQRLSISEAGRVMRGDISAEALRIV